LGNSNLIGRWNVTSKAKTKGITGDVTLLSTNCSLSLTDRRHEWRMFPGLYGEKQEPRNDPDDGHLQRIVTMSREILSQNLPQTHITPLTKQGLWTSFLFRIPPFDPNQKGLFIDIVSGRGHFGLNGYDLGRYWNITKGSFEVDDGNTALHGASYSQRYYFVPYDFLHISTLNDTISRKWNELIFFDVFGGQHNDTRILWSWIDPFDDYNDSTMMEDEADFHSACI
jgi:hypothetical protein